MSTGRLRKEVETNMKHVMIDLETLGSDTSNAPVISIAAVRFEIRGDIDVENYFYRNIKLDDSLRYGNVEAGTLKWWLTGDKREVFREIIFDKKAVNLKTALDQFADWVTQNKGVTPWSKGIDFDFGILERLFRETGVKSPFQQFWKKRDVRTLIDLCKHAGVPELDIGREMGEAHNALSDVIHQAQEVIEYTRALRELTGVDSPE